VNDQKPWTLEPDSPLERNFEAQQPNPVWVDDITYRTEGTLVCFGDNRSGPSTPPS
jgi:hypothetical protein